MRVAIILPRITTLNPFLDPDAEEPQGAEYIAAALIKAGHEATVLLPEPDEELDLFVQRIKEFNPQVVGFSLYTWHVPSALEIARLLKIWKPSLLMVAGGPHPTGAPEFASNPDINYCVLGEGESTIVELLNALSGNTEDVYSIPGLAFESPSEGLVITASRKRIKDLSLCPIHLRDYVVQRGYAIYHPPCSRMVSASVLYSRGCPCDCSFCSSSRLWDQQIIYRPLDVVINEIQDLVEQEDVNYLFFEDLHFCLDAERVRALCRRMQHERMDLSWWCQTSVRSATLDLLGIMKQAGCNKIGWGIESSNTETLDRVGKGMASHLTSTDCALRNAAKMGIVNLGYLVIGFPWETKDSIIAMAHTMAEAEVHQFRVAIATPFPGSRWHASFDPATLSPDLSLYDTNHLVYEHPSITAHDMLELRLEVARILYTSPKFTARVRQFTGAFPQFREGFSEFLDKIESCLNDPVAATRYLLAAQR